MDQGTKVHIAVLAAAIIDLGLMLWPAEAKHHIATRVSSSPVYDRSGKPMPAQCDLICSWLQWHEEATKWRAQYRTK